jgi:hypothetical protein
MEMNKMVQKTFDLAHYHMLLTESMRRTDAESAKDYNWLDAPHELLDSPYGIFRYISTSAQFQMELLNQQLYQDLEFEPETHEKISSLYKMVFNLWKESMKCELL